MRSNNRLYKPNSNFLHMLKRSHRPHCSPIPAFFAKKHERTCPICSTPDTWRTAPVCRENGCFVSPCFDEYPHDILREKKHIGERREAWSASPAFFLCTKQEHSVKGELCCRRYEFTVLPLFPSIAISAKVSCIWEIRLFYHHRPGNEFKGTFPDALRFHQERSYSPS